ncbi:uromodulin-like [Rhinatrema bivittatum]|uniref:uromodulin-like n=1 Tax=Rhinatrema bivittatum TaxID=194408 RepID=UPI0011298DED|nr:uromodulin-like [Rhinatrema bivittatum]
MSTVPLLGGNGEATANIGVFSNPVFTDPVQLDQTVPVGSELYIGMYVTAVDGDTFASTAQNCFAVPEKNPNDPNRVDLIKNSCPAFNFVKMIENGVSLQIRFSIRSFTFGNSGTVYIYCTLRLCAKNSPDCDACKASGRAAGGLESEPMIAGPITFSDPSDSGFHTAFSWTLLAGALLSLRLL